jgi:di/tricarboxylate transporter
VAVTIAASTSFMTPIGDQTNTMVYGMGGYRFGDFARLGLPVTLVSLAAIVIFVPLFWPL